MIIKYHSDHVGKWVLITFSDVIAEEIEDIFGPFDTYQDAIDYGKNMEFPNEEYYLAKPLISI